MVTLRESSSATRLRTGAAAAPAAVPAVGSAAGRNGGLAAFLRARRERIRPEEQHLAAGPRRQVPGLRRDEVAFLAGISTDYYVRLEQGRETRPSETVLAGLGDALLLGPVDRRHLRGLAGAGEQNGEPDLNGARADSTRQMLESLPFPAVLVDRPLDLVAQNAMAASLFAPLLFPRSGPNGANARSGPNGAYASSDGDERDAEDYADNYARAVFLSPSAPWFFDDWAQAARCTTAALRAHTGGDMATPYLAELVAELSGRSEAFVHHWAEHALYQKTVAHKRFHHPGFGALEFTQHTMDLPHGGGHSVWLFHPRDETAEALRSGPAPPPAD